MRGSLGLLQSWRGAALSGALHGATIAAVALTLPSFFTSVPGGQGQAGAPTTIPEAQIMPLVLSPDAALTDAATSDTREAGDERIIALDIVLASTVGFDTANPFDPPEPVVATRASADAGEKGSADRDQAAHAAKSLATVAATLADALPDLAREAAAEGAHGEDTARAATLRGALAEAAARPAQAIEHYRAAAERGDTDGALRLGNLLAGDGATRVEALAAWLVAAETGEPLALAAAAALDSIASPAERDAARAAAHALAQRQQAWRAASGEPARPTAKPLVEMTAPTPAESADAALLAAAERGDAAAVEASLDQGADVGTADAQGRTALMRAAARGDEAMAVGFLRRGADVSARDQYGRTALTEASWSGRPALVALLVDLGADVSAPTNDGASPLMWAAVNGHAAVARLLIERGAVVDARDQAGYTPLIRAAWNGHADVVRVLLDAGADAFARADDGATARSRASGSPAVVALLDVN